LNFSTALRLLFCICYSVSTKEEILSALENSEREIIELRRVDGAEKKQMKQKHNGIDSGEDSASILYPFLKHFFASKVKLWFGCT
jgi:hypothetical protein